jgi:DNA replication protein DnaC
MYMTEELEQLMKSLRMKRTIETFAEQLKAAEKEDISYSDFLARLLRAEWHSRQENTLKARIKRARFPEVWSLETFPFAKQPGVNKRLIRSLADLEFIPKAENIVFIGKSSMGKTGLASGLLLKALENGYRCQFIRAQDLFDEMYASLADRSSRKLLNRLVKLDVLLSRPTSFSNLSKNDTAIGRPLSLPI